jgi:hypothetical protein
MHESMQLRLRLAQAYIPFQVYVDRWEPVKALKMGTIFPELYRPYCGTDERGGWS